MENLFMMLEIHCTKAAFVKELSEKDNSPPLSERDSVRSSLS